LYTIKWAGLQPKEDGGSPPSDTLFDQEECSTGYSCRRVPGVVQPDRAQARVGRQLGELPTQRLGPVRPTQFVDEWVVGLFPGRARHRRPQHGPLARVTRTRPRRAGRGQDRRTEVHQRARPSHTPIEPSTASPADAVAMGNRMVCMFRPLQGTASSKRSFASEPSGQLPRSLI
jgi:hypothetical protein